MQTNKYVYLKAIQLFGRLLLYDYNHYQNIIYSHFA